MNALTGNSMNVGQLRYSSDTRLWIRANRSKFRSYLSTGIDIKWGKKFVRYEVENGELRAFFEDGSMVAGDILVGADGVSSIGQNRKPFPAPFTHFVIQFETRYTSLTHPHSTFCQLE